jgi:outer membrane protein assembly factor BamE (lipoprotein component of BamABCDE complex)
MATLLSAAAALAHAAPGFTVQAGDQPLVKPGMSQDQVRAALGTPARSTQFHGQHTTTWTYQRPEVETVFDVDFGSEGKVIATGERQVPLD